MAKKKFEIYYTTSTSNIKSIFTLYAEDESSARKRFDNYVPTNAIDTSVPIEIKDCGDAD